MQEVTKIEACRLCRGKKLTDIYDFGRPRLSAFTKLREVVKVPRTPIKLVRCEVCKLVQLSHTAPFAFMYSNQYWYKSNVNPVIVDDLKEIAGIASKYAGEKGTVISIGENDGTLLSFVKKGIRRIAVEPASNLIPELEQHADIVHNMFWENVETERANVIVAIGMLYDLEDPNAFMENVREHLEPGGIFIAQLMTLRPMLENADMGNICAEHLEFYTYDNLKQLFERNDLEIFRVEENGINGGSYRLYARALKKGSVDFQEEEPDFDLFVRQLEGNRAETFKFIRWAHSMGKKVYVYGASTKANAILQWYGIDNGLIEGAADRNPAKWGTYMSAGSIPVVDEESARKAADVFLVMPYGFREHFIEREKAWLQSGGVMVFCMPKFEILTQEDL